MHISIKKNHKKASGMTQAVGPEFKPQYYKNEYTNKYIINKGRFKFVNTYIMFNYIK
jgi:hypothetical protein